MKAKPSGPVEAIYLHHRHCSHPSRRPQPGRVRGNCSDLGDAGPAFEKAAQNFRVWPWRDCCAVPPSGLNSCGPSPRIYPRTILPAYSGWPWVGQIGMFHAVHAVEKSLGLRKVRETGFQGHFPV